MKGFSSKRIALKIDVIGLENILFGGNFTGWGSEGVNVISPVFYCFSNTQGTSHEHL